MKGALISFAVACFLILLIIIVGSVIPHLLSASSDEQVILGMLMIILPMSGICYYLYKKLGE